MTAIRQASLALAATVLAPLSFSPLPAQDLQYAKQLSSGGSDFNFVASDDAGNAYLAVAGGQSPITVPGTGSDWLGKFDPDGNCLWATNLGVGVTTLGSIAVGGGFVYVGGWTIDDTSLGTGGYDSLKDGEREGFIVRFDAASGQRLNGTFTADGGGGSQYLDGLTYSGGSVYAVGSDNGNTIHKVNAFDSVPNGNAGKHDPFAMKFSADLLTLHWSTFLPGGSRGARAFGVAASGSDAYVAGRTLSSLTGFPSGGYQSSSAGGKQEAWVIHIDDTVVSSPSLAGGTYLGGNKEDEAHEVAVDGNGDVWVAGMTKSGGFPVTNGSSKSGSSDAFLVKLDASLGSLGFGTYFGGSGTDMAYGVATSGGHVHIAGGTNSSNFPDTNPGNWQNGLGGGSDAFVARFDSAGQLLESALIGGSGADEAFGGVSVDPDGAAILGGSSNSPSFPAADPVANPGAFIAKVSFDPLPPTPGITVSPTSGHMTAEDGSVSGSFDVVLDTQPSGLVTVDITSNDATEGQVSSGAQGPATVISLSFDGTTWDDPQTVTITGVDDPDTDGPIAYVVTSLASSGDTDYDGLSGDDVSVINIDDDAVMVTVDSVAPSSINAGQSGLEIMVAGSGFQPGATISFEGGKGPAPQVDQIVSVSNALIVAEISVAGGGKPGTREWTLRVTNPDTSTEVWAQFFLVIK